MGNLMKVKKSVLSKSAVVTSTIGGLLAGASVASAQITLDAQTAIASSQADALTVGGYVVSAIGALIVVGLIVKFMRKM